MSKTEIIVAIDYKLLYEELLGRCAELEVMVAKLQDGYKPPLSNSAHEFFTNLQYKAKNLKTQVDEFKSGKKYVDMQESFKAQLAARDREIKRLKNDLAAANRHCSLGSENMGANA